ncbi:MAG: 4Fe-4S binding protein [Rickettsiales bacterium]|jgi:iron-only hydrogenase group A|nr:4Fe-4S binding protein [Rickettsiales bacterium]
MLYLKDSIQFENAKCKKCMRCVLRCKNNSVNHIFVDLKERLWREWEEHPCIGCGQCTLVCPFDAITEQYCIEDVKNVIADKNKVVIIQAAPSIRSIIPEKKLYTALRKLGFDKIFDVNFGANITTNVEVDELLERLNNPNAVLPMFTSCCPAWVESVLQYHPELKPNLTTAKSPNLHAGFAYKTWWAAKEGVDPHDIVVVSIMPCTAKKDEIKRKNAYYNGKPLVDYVLTFREISKMLKEANINYEDLEDGSAHSLGEYTSDANLYGQSGGVMESALRTAYFKLTSKNLENVEIKEIRPDMSGFKSAEIEVNGIKLKLAIITTMKNFEKLLPDLKEYHYIEVMNCVGGCVGGGGMPLLPLKPDEQIKVIDERRQKLIELDKGKAKKFAHENELVKEYLEWTKTRGKHFEHEALHNEF